MTNRLMLVVLMVVVLAGIVSTSAVWAQAGTPTNFTLINVGMPPHSKVSWTPAAPGDQTRVFRSSSGAPGTFVQATLTAADDTYYVDPATQGGNTYWFYLVGTNGSGDSAPTETKSRFCMYEGGGGVPSAPTNLAANEVAGPAINLGWTDNAGNEEGYKVYFSATSSSGPFTLVAALAANSTSYQYQGSLEGNGATYWFRVDAYNSYGTTSSSVAAVTINAPTPPLAASDLRGEGRGDPIRAILTWVNVSRTATGIEVYRSDASNGTYVLLTNPALAADATTYTDLDRTGGSTMWYKVRTLSGGGWSETAPLAVAVTADGNMGDVIAHFLHTQNMPASAIFTDDSTGSPTWWHWNFGDGSESYVQNPGFHQYNAHRMVTVSLTVTSGADSDTYTETFEVFAPGPLQP